MTDFLDCLVGIALALLTLGFSSFVLLFHVLAHWQRSEMGRHVMTFMSTITLILWYFLLDRVFNFPNVVNSVSQLALFGTMSVVVWKRLALLIRIQKEARAQAAHEFWSRNGD